MEKIKFDVKEAEKTVRELLIGDIVELELDVSAYQTDLNCNKCNDENLVTAMVTIAKIKLEALKQAIIDDGFEF